MCAGGIDTDAQRSCGPRSALSFSPDGTRLAVGSFALGYTDSAFVFDLPDPSAQPKLIDRDAATVAYDPAGRFISLGYLSSGTALTLVDASTYKPLESAATGRIAIRTLIHPTRPVVMAYVNCSDFAPINERRDAGGLTLFDAEERASARSASSSI